MRLPRVRFTVRGMMVAVAILAALVAPWAWLACETTYYAPGFSEAAFARLRVGMTASEVVALLGEPLERVPQESDGSVLWTYSARPDDTCDFEMRWVYLRGDEVATIVAMHWDD